MSKIIRLCLRDHGPVLMSEFRQQARVRTEFVNVWISDLDLHSGPSHSTEKKVRER